MLDLAAQPPSDLALHPLPRPSRHPTSASPPPPPADYHLSSSSNSSPPSHFLCPISLDIMRDPVTLSSGQTFDRPSIQRWIRDGHRTCPVTRLPIADADREILIPNHVLRRLIDSWCLQNAAASPPKPLPTPPPPPRRPSSSHHHISSLLDTFLSIPSASNSHHPFHSPSAAVALIRALQTLSSAAAAHPRLRRRIAHSGAISRLTHLLSSSLSASPAPPAAILRETLRLLSHLNDDVPAHSYLWEPDRPDHALTLASVVAAATPKSASVYDRETRLHAAVVLSRTKIVDDETKKRIGETAGLVAGLASILATLEETSAERLLEGVRGGDEYWERRQYWKGAEAVLYLLVEVVGESLGQRREAVEVGMVGRMREVLEKWWKEEEEEEEEGGKAAAEWALLALEGMCKTAEGRRKAAEESGGGGGGQRLLRVVVAAMGGAGERRLRKLAVRALYAWLREAPPKSSSALRGLLKMAAAELGAVPKALAVAQECRRPASITRSAALSLAKSLSAFAPSFYHL